MAVPSTPNCGSQLERACANYFVQSGIGLWTPVNFGVDVQIAPADALQIKYYPNLTIMAHSSTHEPVQSGNEVYETTITLKWSVAANPNPPNLYSARVKRDFVIGQVQYCMMLSSGTNGNMPLDQTVDNIEMYGRQLAMQGSAQDQANNADMAEFSCFAVYFMGSVRCVPDEAGCSYVEVRHYKIEVCPSAIN